MNMRADFDTFAAELLDQIEVFQTLSRAVATIPAVRDPALESTPDTRKPAVEAGKQSSPSRLDNQPLDTQA
jgi:hypothetical protein